MNTVECPECGKTLKTANPIAPGKKVRCPGCKEIFTMPSAKAPSSTAVRTKSAPPPARPPVDDDEDLPRPKRKRRDEEDEDIDDRDDEDEDDRPRKKKKKKKQAGMNWALIGGGAGALVLILILVLGFVWPGFFTGGGGGPALAAGTGQENLLAYLPANTGQVFGGEASRIPPFLKNTFTKYAQLAQQQAGAGGLPAGLSGGVEEMLNDTGKFVMAGSGDGPQATMVVALQTKTPFDLKKITKSFQAEKIPAKEHQGRIYFSMPQPVAAGPPIFLGLPNNRIVVVGGMPEEQFKTLLATDGQQSRLSPAAQTLVASVEKHYLWGALAIDEQSRQQLQMGGAQMAMMVPELKTSLPALTSMKGVSLWLQESPGDKQKLTVALSCASDQHAAALGKSFNGLWAKGRAMLAGLGFMAAQPGKESLKDLINDAASLKIETKGDVTSASVAFSEKTLTALEQMQQEMMQNMGGQGQPPPGFGQPPAGFPKKQPPPPQGQANAPTNTEVADAVRNHLRSNQQAGFQVGVPPGGKVQSVSDVTVEKSISDTYHIVKVKVDYQISGGNRRGSVTRTLDVRLNRSPAGWMVQSLGR